MTAPESHPDDLLLRIQNVAAQPVEGASTLRLRLETTRGRIAGLLDVCEGETGALVTCSGAVSGPHEVLGPGDRVYESLAGALPEQGVTTLRLSYREAGEFEECVLDVLAACSFLAGVGAERIVLAGHSFGGAVVIKAGQLAPRVAAVASLSPQLFGTRQVERLAKPLLLIHGTMDAILDHAASEDIYARAHEPKRLVLLDGTGHGLQEQAPQLRDELETFILEHARPRPTIG